MRTLVLGAGGIGGYFGGRLVEAGADITFLVRPARAERLRTDGLVIASPLGGAKLDVKAVTAVEAPFDLVLLSCKAYDLDEAITAIRPAIGAETAVLPLLNGLAHLDRLDEALGSGRVLGGLAAISVTMSMDGTIHHLSPLNSLTFGARDAADERACDAVTALLRPAALEVRRSDDIIQDMWEKFAFITAAAGMTCLMRANVGAIMATDDGQRLMLGMLAECHAVAAAAGFAPRPPAASFATRLLTREASFTASMLRDLEAGARIEAEHLQGDMIHRAMAHGVAADLLRVAYCHLQSYQERRASR